MSRRLSRLKGLSRILMKNGINITLFRIIFSLLINCFLFYHLGFSSELDSFFKRYKEVRGKVQVLVGEFVQKSIYPDEIYTTTGKVVYVKPDRLVFYTKDPEKTTILDGKRVYEYEVDIKQVVIYDLADQVDVEIFFIAFTEDVERLKDRYRISTVIVDDERGKEGISIKPLEGNEKDASFREILIMLRDEDCLPYRIRMVNVDEVQTVVDFDKVVTNCKISPKDTQVYLPKGTAVILNDKLIERVGESGKYIPEPAKIPAELILSSENLEEDRLKSGEKVPERVIMEEDLPSANVVERR